MNANTPDGTARWGRKMGFGGVIAIAVGLLIVLPASVSATPAFTLKSPYSGSTYAALGGDFEGCGGNATWGVNPFFNVTNGHAHVSAAVTTPACKTADSYAESYASAEFESAIFVLTSGHHSVKAKWTASYKIDLVAKPGPGSQTAQAYDEVYVYGYIADLTNDTYFDSTHSTFFSNSTWSGTIARSFNGVTLVVFVNGTFAAGHSYEILTGVEVYGAVTVSAGSSKGSASVNCGTSGEKAVLDSITAT